MPSITKINVKSNDCEKSSHNLQATEIGILLNKSAEAIRQQLTRARTLLRASYLKQEQDGRSLMLEPEDLIQDEIEHPDQTRQLHHTYTPSLADQQSLQHIRTRLLAQRSTQRATATWSCPL